MAVPSNLPTNTPVIQDPLGNGYANITQLAEAIASRLDREHVVTRNTSTPSDHEGLHKAGSAIAFFQETAPAARLDGVAFSEDDAGLVWFQPNYTGATLNYVTLYIYSGTAFVKVASFDNIATDVITERTTDAGVTIDGLLLKDRNILNALVLEAATRVLVGSSGLYPTYVTGRAFRFGTAPANPQAGDMWMA